MYNMDNEIFLKVEIQNKTWTLCTEISRIYVLHCGEMLTNFSFTVCVDNKRRIQQWRRKHITRWQAKRIGLDTWNDRIVCCAVIRTTTRRTRSDGKATSVPCSLCYESINALYWNSYQRISYSIKIKQTLNFL